MASSVLHDALRGTHEELCSRLAVARTMTAQRAKSRRGCPPIDMFLAEAAKHMHAVDAVLVPAVRRECHDGHGLLHEYMPSCKQLEVLLAHVKAHEYGSAYETSFDWNVVWDDVDNALGEQWRHEERMADQLDSDLDDARLAALAQALGKAEMQAPTRPHPYLPHTGPFGRVARGMMRVADSFWDNVEGRFVPEKERKPHKKPGLIGQYLMADPRFDEEETTDREAAADRQDVGRD